MNLPDKRSITWTLSVDSAFSVYDMPTGLSAWLFLFALSVIPRIGLYKWSIAF